MPDTSIKPSLTHETNESSTYENFPTIYNDKISLRQIQFFDLKDLIEISFYDAIQATTVKEAVEMQTKINKDYKDGNSIHCGASKIN